MAMVDTLTVEPNELGIEPGDYSVHSLDCIGTHFLLSADGKLSVESEGHQMWGNSEYTDDCLAGFLRCEEVEIVGGNHLEYLIDISDNVVTEVKPAF